MDSKSLFGKTVLVTRPREQSARFIEEIEHRGGRALVFPTIRILPPVTWTDLDAAIARLPTFTGFLFTSVNAVRWFWERCQIRGVGAQAFESRNVFAVGEKTGEALQDLGIRVKAVPEEQSAKGLLASLSGETLTDAHFLFPRGDLAGDDLLSGLEQRGARVETVVVYRTAPPDEGAARELRSRIFKGQIDVITFFSPSAVRNFVRLCDSEMLQRLLQSARCAAIGPTTGDAMIRAGLRVDIRGAKPNAESLAQAIEDGVRNTTEEEE